jgi:serine/threonine protein kinase
MRLDVFVVFYVCLTFFFFFFFFFCSNFGAVYSATHNATQYLLAVKKLHVEVQSELAELQREISIMQQCGRSCVAVLPLFFSLFTLFTDCPCI